MAAFLKDLEISLMGFMTGIAALVFLILFGGPTAATFFFLGPLAWVPTILVGIIIFFWILGSLLVFVGGLGALAIKMLRALGIPKIKMPSWNVWEVLCVAIPISFLLLLVENGLPQ